LRRPTPFQRRSNHGERGIRAYVRAGLDIAKPIALIVDVVGEWIADDCTFSTKALFARNALRAACSF